MVDRGDFVQFGNSLFADRLRDNEMFNVFIRIIIIVKGEWERNVNGDGLNHFMFGKNKSMKLLLFLTQERRIKMYRTEHA